MLFVDSMLATKVGCDRPFCIGFCVTAGGVALRLVPPFKSPRVRFTVGIDALNRPGTLGETLA